MAVLIRHGGERALQGLRTALSLSLGDRPAAVYLVREGLEVLGAAAESETGRCLATLLDDLGTEVVADSATQAVPPGVARRPLARILGEVGRASFQQTF